MKVLITGFDPFGGESVNPALEAVKALPDTIAGAEIIKLEIPTVFRKSLEKIEENIIKHSPDIVISIGQAGGRFGVTPERVAINIDEHPPETIPIIKGKAKSLIDGTKIYIATIVVKVVRVVFIDLDIV